MDFIILFFSIYFIILLVYLFLVFIEFSGLLFKQKILIYIAYSVGMHVLNIVTEYNRYNKAKQYLNTNLITVIYIFYTIKQSNI
jgi:hypothetical protein